MHKLILASEEFIGRQPLGLAVAGAVGAGSRKPSAPPPHSWLPCTGAFWISVLSSQVIALHLCHVDADVIGGVLNRCPSREEMLAGVFVRGAVMRSR